jgi:hypothetical protein
MVQFLLLCLLVAVFWKPGDGKKKSACLCKKINQMKTITFCKLDIPAPDKSFKRIFVF